jgi:putative NADH-flavin reductase
MKIAIFGATGAVGHECLVQALEAGHEVSVLVRTPSKLPAELRERVRVVEGDGLNADDVVRTLSAGVSAGISAEASGGVDAVLFAIGVDKNSPENLCTDVTRHILDAMPRLGVQRLIWCGGGSTLVAEDQITFGARFVEFVANTFMGLRHRDKQHQLDLLEERKDIAWLGVRPLQIRKAARLEQYRLGFDPFSGLSKISFADVAHAMIGMLNDDRWMHKAPILQY